MAKAVLVALVPRETALEGTGSKYNQVTQVYIAVCFQRVCM